MAPWPAATTAVAMCLLGAVLLMAISVSAQPPPSPGSWQDMGPSPPPPGKRNVSCTDTEGKRPPCSSTCPDSCPQNCIVLCPNCTTYCPDQVRPVEPVPPPAIFVFGDGTVDVGNNNYLPGGAEAGEPPRANHDYYGIDLQSPGTLGRFSNGYVLSDFIAKFMGFQSSPPPYLSLPSQMNMQGVNYASADAGIRGGTNGGLTIGLPEQLDNFKNTRGKMEAKLGAKALSDLLSKSFFLISVGTMDLIPDCNPLWNWPSKNDNLTEVQHLVILYGEAITSLYNMGARRFGLVNVGLVGCGPDRHSEYSSGGGCDESMNKHAVEFNAGLKPLMAGLTSNLHGLRYSIADYYAFNNATFANPSAYGFLDTTSACCPAACDPKYAQYFGTPCGNRAQYWYWDDGYTTEQAASVLATAFYYGPAKYTEPVTFRALLDKK